MNVRLAWVTLLLAGCNDFGHALERCVDAGGCLDEAGALLLSPEATTLAVGNMQTFTASGGRAPFVFSMVSGPGDIDASSGRYIATAAGQATVQVVDAVAQVKTATVQVLPALRITPSVLAMAVNTTTQFTATGGVPPLVFSVFSGGGSVATTGFYTAGPVGTVVVRVTDALNNTADATVTVGVALSVTPTSATIAVGNTLSLAPAGGVPPYAFTLVSGMGDLEAGVYVAPAAPTTAVIRVTDAQASAVMTTVTVNPGLSLPPTQLTLAVTNRFAFSADGGVPPYTYSLTGAGTVNAGLYVAPSTPGVDVVQVADALGNTASATVQVNPAVTIEPTGRAITVTNTLAFGADGGAGRVQFSVVDGGGSIGAFSGVFIPADAGVSVVAATDVLGNKATALITVTPALTLAPKTLPVGGQLQLTAAGGVPPVTFAVPVDAGTVDDAGVWLAAYAPFSGAARVTDSLGNTATAPINVTGFFGPAMPLPVTVDGGAGSNLELTVGDWNNDGRADLAATFYPDDRLMTFLGNGDGTFTLAMSAPTRRYPYGISHADLDQDGLEDLVVANYFDSSISVSRGLGTGSFAPAIEYAVDVAPRRTVTRDYNRDGRLDLAVVNDLGITVLLAAAGGAFTRLPRLDAGVLALDIGAADWNRDGIVDLVATNFTSLDFTTYRGVGDGTFVATAATPLPTDAGLIAIDDLNQDGVDDLIIASGLGAAATLAFGRGDGTFEPGRTLGTRGVRIAVADFNLDGHSDILGNFSLAFGTGDGGFVAAATGFLGAAAVADFNRDGRPDIVAANFGNTTINVSLNRIPAFAKTTFAAQPPVVFPARQFASLADWNRDGKLDVCLPDRLSDALVCSAGNGDGTFTQAGRTALPGRPWAIGGFDLNVDGRLDAVVTMNGDAGSFAVLNGDSRWGFVDAGLYNLAPDPRAVVSEDFNRDGLPDLALSQTFSPSAVVVHLAQAGGGFAPAAVYASANFPQGLATADVDHDGKVDVISSSFGNGLFGVLSVLKNRGAGTFLDGGSYQVGVGAGKVSAVDMNRDGHADLVCNSSFAGAVSINFGTGTGTFGPAVVFDAGVQPIGLVTADLNVDGLQDVAVSSSTENEVRLFFGLPDGGLQQPWQSLPVCAVPSHLAAGDVNHDGRPDLFVTCAGSGGSYQVFLNTSL